MKKSILEVVKTGAKVGSIGLALAVAACSAEPQIIENAVDCTNAHFDHVDCADCAAIPQAPNDCQGVGASAQGRAMDCSAKSAAASAILVAHWLQVCPNGTCNEKGSEVIEHRNAMWNAYDAAVVSEWYKRNGGEHSVGHSFSEVAGSVNRVHNLINGANTRYLCITDADRGTYADANNLKKATTTGAIKAALEALDAACVVDRH